MANTAKYILKSDRTKTVEVITPMFAMATIVGTDGKKTEMSRAEFDQLYEPALPKATLNEPGARTQSAGLSDAQAEKMLSYLTSLGGAVEEIARKVDEIHKVAVAPKESNGREG